MAETWRKFKRNSNLSAGPLLSFLELFLNGNNIPGRLQEAPVYFIHGYNFNTINGSKITDEYNPNKKEHFPTRVILQCH